MKLSPKRSVTSSRRELKNSLDALARTLGQVEMRPIDSIRNYARNPRKHPERQLVALEASIREFGFTIPAVIGSDDELIAGEARLEAARRQGFTEVPVLVAQEWTPAQKKAYRLTDNRLTEHATWDIEFLAAEIRDIVEVGETPIDLLGWETAEIDVICDEARAQEADASDPADAAVELPATAVTEPGDLWLLRKHRALCGSALIESDWERLMAGAIASMSISDPPFNVPITGHVCGLGKIKHDPFAMATGEMTKPEFVEFLTNFIRLIARHCHDGSVIDVFMDWRSISELHQALTAAGLTILNLCVWNKGNGGMGSLYRSKHELVYIAKKGKAPHRNNVELGKHGRYRTNVWDYAGVNSFGANRMNDLADHPTVKPTALIADAIRDVTAHGDIVTDAFLGSGTLCLAAERTGRVAYGMEIEPRYVDVAIRRWETLTGLQAVLEETGETFAQVAARRGVDDRESSEDDEDDEGSEPIDVDA